MHFAARTGALVCAEGVECEDEPGGAVGFCLANGGGYEPAECGGVELIGLPCPGEDEALGLEANGTVEDCGLEETALGFARGFDIFKPLPVEGADGVAAGGVGTAMGFELEN